MWAPIATRKRQRSATSGSRAAPSIVVTPSAHTAAVTKFSVAPTLGKEKRMSAPTSRGALTVSTPSANVQVAPMASSPAICMSIGRSPKSSPPGRAISILPTRETSGPSRLIDARIRPARSAGTLVDNSPEWVMRNEPSLPVSTWEPIERRRSDMMSTSTISGTLSRLNSPSASTVAAINFRTEFFAPGTRTVPCKGPRWSMRITGSATSSVIPVLSLGTATVCSRRDGKSGHSNSDVFLGGNAPSPIGAINTAS